MSNSVITMPELYIPTQTQTQTDSDSDSDRGLFNIKLHTKVLHQVTLQNNTNILNKYEPGIIKNTC